MQLRYDNFAEQLRTVVPGFERVYDEHVSDYDEVLPHVLLGDLVRFLSAEVELRGAEALALKKAIPLLEDAACSEDERLQELIVVSFLENLEPDDPSFLAIRNSFGPGLEEHYRLLRNAEDNSQ